MNDVKKRRHLSAEQKWQIYQECQQPDTKTGEILRKHGLYSSDLQRISKFVETSANKIGVSQSLSGVESGAFQNPDGSKIVIVVNTGYNRRSFYLVQDDLRLYYSLAGQAVATFIW